MAHLIETIYEASLKDAYSELERAHSIIVSRAIEAQVGIGKKSQSWGVELKRLEVSLPLCESLIGKPSEKFVEIVNILATTERTLSALRWLETQYPNSFVRECHASTSDDIGGNDIVLVDSRSGEIVVRCEVTDVTSSNPGQNGKEKKDLKNLSCDIQIPDDSVKRYIATSFEFSNALSSERRNWSNMHYRYVRHSTEYDDQTVLLEIVNAQQVHAVGYKKRCAL